MNFFECPNCGFFHPAGFTGDCEDVENRYDMDMLEALPDGQWEEIDPPAAAKLTNLDRLNKLRPDIDLNGNRLEVGCNVRFYGSACYEPTDTIGGIALTDTEGAAKDGVLEAIGVTTEADPVPHYVIRCTSESFINVERRGDLILSQTRLTVAPVPEIIRPYVNGQPIMRCVVKSGNLWVFSDQYTCPQFAVFRL